MINPPSYWEFIEVMKENESKMAAQQAQFDKNVTEWKYVLSRDVARWDEQRGLKEADRKVMERRLKSRVAGEMERARARRVVEREVEGDARRAQVERLEVGMMAVRNEKAARKNYNEKKRLEEEWEKLEREKEEWAAQMENT